MSGVTKNSKVSRGVPLRPSVRERRRGARLQSLTAGRVGDVVVQVLDVSLSGVGFRSTERFEPGSVHDVVIGNGPMFLESTICVMSVRPRRDGTFDVGCVFI